MKKTTKFLVGCFLLIVCGLFVVSCKSSPNDDEPVLEETVETVDLNAKEHEFIVYFAPGAQTVDVFMAGKLDAIANSIKELAPTEKITVEGHSARLDTTREEQQIAAARAANVTSYLRSLGILGDVEFESCGYGAEKPVAEHSDMTNRWQNRRVVIAF